MPPDQRELFDVPQPPSVADNLLVRRILDALRSCDRDYCGTCGGIRGAISRAEQALAELAREQPDALYAAVEGLPLRIVQQLPNAQTSLRAALKGLTTSGKDISRLYLDELRPGMDPAFLSLVVPSLPVDGAESQRWIDHALHALATGRHGPLASALARSAFARKGDSRVWNALLLGAEQRPNLRVLEAMLLSCPPDAPARGAVFNLLLARVAEAPAFAIRMYPRLPAAEAEELHLALKAVVPNEGALALQLWKALPRHHYRRLHIARAVLEAAQASGDSDLLLRLARGMQQPSGYINPDKAAEIDIFVQIIQLLVTHARAAANSDLVLAVARMAKALPQPGFVAAQVTELLMAHGNTTADPVLVLTIARLLEDPADRAAILVRLPDLAATEADHILIGLSGFSVGGPVQEILLDGLERIAPEHERSVRRRAHRERSAERARWLAALGQDYTTTVERLAYVAHSGLNVVVFPAEWAECTDEELHQLPVGTGVALLGRMDRIRRGPWKRLARRLRAIEPVAREWRGNSSWERFTVTHSCKRS